MRIRRASHAGAEEEQDRGLGHRLRRLATRARVDIRRRAVSEAETGGVVNFAVAGFHQIYVYVPGVRVEDIQVPVSGTFVEDLFNLYYKGILPPGGSPPAIAATVSPSNAMNRLESVSFNEPGVYLVICNVRTHFLDGMYAYVRVTGAATT